MAFDCAALKSDRCTVEPEHRTYVFEVERVLGVLYFKLKLIEFFFCKPPEPKRQ